MTKHYAGRIGASTWIRYPSCAGSTFPTRGEPQQTIGDWLRMAIIDPYYPSVTG
jgi:hypothetical protein